MKKINKIIMFHAYYIPHIGGSETHMDEFAKYLSKEGYDITIFVPRIPNNAKEYEIRWNNVKVIRFKAFEIISNYPIPKVWSYDFWYKFLKLYKQRYDIVITRTRFFFTSLIGLVFAKFRLKPIKLIHVEHGSSFVILESKIKTKIARLYDIIIGKFIFKKADKIVAISQAVKDFICKNFINCKKKNIPIIRRGIDYEIYKNIKSNKEIKVKYKNRIKFVYLGRLYKWKGLENTIKAIKEIEKPIKKKFVFLIVGYGEDEERLKKLANKELNKTIFFLGKKDFKEAISILKSCDAYIHSSYPGGGLSNSLLQALYLKLWVIASPHEGAKEVVVNNKNGFLLKDNKAESIKEAIIRYVRDRKKYKIDAKTYNTFVKEFRWDSVIKKYIKIFDEIIRLTRF